jgi:hypothetical protein
VGAREASRDNSLQNPSRETLDLGAPYRFTLAGADTTLRFSVANDFSKHGFRTNGSGVFTPLGQRFSESLTADF